MGKRYFTEEQINRLKDHPCIVHISEKSITYSDDFKARAVKVYETGVSPRMIFKNEGLSLNDLGFNRIDSSLKRWRSMSKREAGFRDTRSTNSKGRPRTRPRTPEEELKYLKDKVEYLEQENEFLKKLRALERQVNAASKLKTNTKSSIK